MNRDSYTEKTTRPPKDIAKRESLTCLELLLPSYIILFDIITPGFNDLLAVFVW
jgi:hypothetical protein